MTANSLLFYKICFGVKNCLARSITRAFPLLYLQSEHWYTYVLFMWINVFPSQYFLPYTVQKCRSFGTCYKFIKSLDKS
jgi:hypothetical protein